MPWAVNWCQCAGPGDLQYAINTSLLITVTKLCAPFSMRLTVCLEFAGQRSLLPAQSLVLTCTATWCCECPSQELMRHQLMTLGISRKLLTMLILVMRKYKYLQA